VSTTLSTLISKMVTEEATEVGSSFLSHLMAKTSADAADVFTIKRERNEPTTGASSVTIFNRLLWQECGRHWGMREQKHRRREFKKWHHVNFEFKFVLQVLLLDKNIELHDLAGPWDWSAGTRDLPKLAIFVHPQRNLEGLRATHGQILHCVLHLCPAKEPKKTSFDFFRRNYWTCRVCVHAKERPKE